MTNILSDPAAERAVLAGICQHNADAYLDVADLLQPITFTIDSNEVLYKCLSHIFDDDIQSRVDVSSVYSAAHDLGLDHLFKNNQEVQHLKAIFDLKVGLPNVRKFAAKIRKLQVSRLLHSQLGTAQDKILDVSGSESVAYILGIAEDAIFDFTSLLHDNDSDPDQIGEGLDEYLQYLEDNPVEQLGLPTGFFRLDEAIGGGLRRGTVNVIGARSKVGKTTLGINMGNFIASNGIPVLNLDTEMLKADHVQKLLAMNTEVPVLEIAKGKYATNQEFKNKIHNFKPKMKEMAYFHRNVSNQQFEEQLAVMRRWIVKTVGLNADGQAAKDCVIIYDYLKLLNTEGLGGSGDIKEYQLLGFMMTTLHNFAIRYQIPIVVFIQLNRDGITKETSDAVSGSDRIMWLCSNLTFLKEKTDDEIAQDGGLEVGNRKLVTIDCRHGPGLEYGNYINVIMKGYCAKFTESRTRFEIEAERESQEDTTIVSDEDIPFE